MPLDVKQPTINHLYIPLELTDTPLAGVLLEGGETGRPISIARQPSRTDLVEPVDLFKHFKNAFLEIHFFIKLQIGFYLSTDI